MRSPSTASKTLRGAAPTLALALALACCAACAPSMRAAQPTAQPQTTGADSTYHYLEYQALLLQITKSAGQARLSPEAFARTLQYQEMAAQARHLFETQYTYRATTHDLLAWCENPCHSGDFGHRLDLDYRDYPLPPALPTEGPLEWLRRWL